MLAARSRMMRAGGGGSRESHTKSQFGINEEPPHDQLDTGEEQAEVTGENKQRVKERPKKFEGSQNSIGTGRQNSHCRYTLSGRNETQAHSSFDSQKMAKSEKAVCYDKHLTTAGITDCHVLNYANGDIEHRRGTEQLKHTVEIEKEYTLRFKEFEKQVQECNNSNCADCKIHNCNTSNISISPAERQIDQIREINSICHNFNPSTLESVKNEQRLQQLQEKRPLNYLPDGAYTYYARNLVQQPGIRSQQRPCGCRSIECTKRLAMVPPERVNDMNYLDNQKLYYDQESRNYYNAPVNTLHRIVSDKDLSRSPQLRQHLIDQTPEQELLQFRLKNARSLSNSTSKTPYSHPSYPMRLSRQLGSEVNHSFVSNDAGRVLAGGNNRHSGAVHQFSQSQHQRSLHTSHSPPNSFDYSRPQAPGFVQQNANSTRTARLDKFQPNVQKAKHIQASSDNPISRTHDEDFGDDGNECQTQAAENDCSGESVWGGEVGRVFDEANAMFPAQGRQRITNGSDDKKHGRNNLIAQYIYERTGKHRTTKQISSHVQVLKRRQMSGSDRASDSDVGSSSEKDKSSYDIESTVTKRVKC